MMVLERDILYYSTSFLFTSLILIKLKSDLLYIIYYLPKLTKLTKLKMVKIIIFS